MDMFDKRFVHFLWDDKLEGKRCFVADNIGLLIYRVNSCDEEHRHTVHRHDGKCADPEGYPFAAGDDAVSLERFSRFAYYDPHYDERLSLLAERESRK